VNGIGAAGLWQIYGLPFPGNPLDAATNARMAVAKFRGAGGSFTPWTTYTGADTPGHERTYLRYMPGHSGGVLGAVGGAIGSAVGAVGGIMGDLLSQGAGFILDKLPGVGDLPDWVQGMGHYALDKVTGSPVVAGRRCSTGSPSRRGSCRSCRGRAATGGTGP
jgi:hypothetical protein